jgi:hypothetical protein
MRASKPASGNSPAYSEISELHTKTLHLHGLMAVLTNFDPHDLRTSNGAAAVAFAAEGLAEEIAKGMEKVMEGTK